MNDQAIPAHWSEKPAEEILVLAVLNLVLEMVLADSRLTVEELDAALGMVNFYLPPPGLTVEDFGEMVADAAARPPDRRSEITGELLEGIAGHLDMEDRKKFVAVAMALAGSDGSFMMTEMAVVLNAAKRLGFDDPEAVVAELMTQGSPE
jgi:uncharacterized tellurite resistance protein B-like protein